MKKVLDKITRATGYKIKITDGWENKLVTVDIQGMTLDDSLRKILRALGNPNNSTVDYSDKKVINIIIFNTAKGTHITKRKEGSQPQNKQYEAMINMDAKSHLQEQESTGNPKAKIDPLDMEVLPPKNPGQRGITIRELKGESNQKQLDPLDVDMEILPPEKPGERGITLRELKRESNQKQLDPLDVEVIPPENVKK